MALDSELQFRVQGWGLKFRDLHYNSVAKATAADMTPLCEATLKSQSDS